MTSLAALDTGGQLPVLLIHGLGGFKELWERQVSALSAAGFRVVAVDLRGHGRSGSPAGPWTIGDFAADVVETLDSLAIERAVVVGHSLGGRTAFSMTLAHPSRVAALVAVGAQSEAPPEPYASVLRGVRDATAARGMAGFKETFAAAGEIPEAVGRDARLARWYWRRFDRNRPGDLVSSLDAILTMPRLTERLPAITVPFLALVGERDLPFLELANRYSSLIVNATTAIVPDCGHYPMIDGAGPFRVALLEFLDRCRSELPW